MGFSVGPGKGKGPVSEINVTPFVDVVLVLLVIFMITAPLMYNGIKLQLPRTKRVHSVKLTQDQVILSLNRAGELFLGKTKVLSVELLKEIKARFKTSGTDVVYLRAHYGLKYGQVAKLMSELKTGGIEKISLVTEATKDP